ncbi:hypothetical protein BCR34DRAFT_544032 [Clohesyomyces aquaticus]|uniref:Uncharacterized protein n=1 Tax=Clohesyomyces aquaticus TaxID=1231657 RepID=A0A1Y1Z5T8_9PLEO|nr:hypothetical protein BCR34DRAFT_544032 [Clohesyomyces aquaticus]
MSRDNASSTSKQVSGAISPGKPLSSRTTSTRFQDPNLPSHTPSQNHDHGQPPQHNPNQIHKNSSLSRPALHHRRTTVQTRYISMLLALDAIPTFHNFLASFFTWLLLAGYLVFPATFSSFQKRGLDDMEAGARNELEKKILGTVKNVSLLYVAAFCCGVGVAGSTWLWWKHRKNYVWVIQRLLVPCLMNSIAGLLSTLVNVYSARDGQYSVTAKATLGVTGAFSVVGAALFLLYNYVALSSVKRKHRHEVRDLEKSLGGEDVLRGRG